jgi:hypothetical protein
MEITEPEDTAIGLLVTELAHSEDDVELPSLTCDRITNFQSRNNLDFQYYSNYMGFYFYLFLRPRTYKVEVDNLAPEKKDEGGVRVSARCVD